MATDSFEYNNLCEREKPHTIENLVYLLMIGIMISLSIFVLSYGMCRIDGQSMQNTLQHEDNVLLYKWERNFERNDIIVFKYLGNDKLLIKRIIGVEGDTLMFKRSGEQVVLYRNSELVDESYIKEPMLYLPSTTFPPSKVQLDTPIVVGKGKYFVMGDNRNNSMDSRSIGQIERTDITGRMALRLKKDGVLEWLLKILYRPTTISQH